MSDFHPAVALYRPRDDFFFSDYIQGNLSDIRIKPITCNNMRCVRKCTVNPKNATFQPLLICIVNFINGGVCVCWGGGGC